MHPALRHCATVIAFGSLALLAIRPERTATIHPTDALLVTPGANPARARRLADSLGTARVIALTGTDSVPDAGYVARHFGDARRLHVAGWGLLDDEWEVLGAAPASLHPAPPPPGFVHAAWPRTVALGDEVRVDGSLVSTARWVYLGDAGGVWDSVRVDSAGTFSLRAVPRAVGPQSFALWADGVAAETLGVVVTEAPRWRTLIVTAAPSFEAAALRDYLAGRGAAVTWRAGVSRERTRTEFVNRATAPHYASLELLVIDGRSLDALTARERATLQQAVRDSGLGVLVLPDAALATAAPTIGFALTPDTALSERLVRPRSAEGQAAATPVPAAAFTLRDSFGARNVLWNASGDVLAQVRPAGAGRFGLTLVTAPSRWIRGGERAAFAAYWAPLLAAVARTPPGDHWTVGDGTPQLARRPVELAVRSATPRPWVIVAGPGVARASVYLTPDAVEPGRWVGRYWPREPGWYAIADAGDAAWYVAPADAWAAKRAADRLHATARWMAVAPAAGAARSAQATSRPIPLGWWLALFTLAAGVLWADRRRAYIRAMPRTVVAVLLLGLLGCSKSDEERRDEVARCGGLSSDADVIAVCLMTEHKWKEGPADSAGKREGFRIDSMRVAQEAAMWNSDSVRHKAALKACAKTNDARECLLVRHGWPADRATRSADSLWARDAAAHGRQIRSCSRSQGPIASCLMLNYKWNAPRAMATEDSVRRARLR